MFLFVKKKREDNLRPLTEREIQERLYGQYRTKVPVVDSGIPPVPAPQSVGELFAPPEHHPVEENRVQPVQLSERSAEQAAIPSYAVSHRSKKCPSRATWEFPVAIISRFGKPKWIQKIEGIPLSMITVIFFGLVFAAVGVRAVSQLFLGPLSQIKRIPEPAHEVSGVAPGSGKSVALPHEPAASPSLAKKFYTIQLVVYDDPRITQRLVDSLKSKNLDAFTRAIKTSRGKDRYLVFLGHYRTYQEAESELSRYRKANLLATFPDSFVRPQME